MSLKEKLSQLKQRLKNAIGRSDRAVSPVIGVILMVAITVILAAVIGAFVLGLGPGAEPAPSATVSLEENTNDELIIVHNGGDTLDLNEFILRGDGVTGGPVELSGELAPGETNETSVSNPDGTVNLVHEPSGSVIASEDF